LRKVRKRRLQLVMLLLVGVSATTLLALAALQQNLNHFYSPSQIAAGEVTPGSSLRAGGMVVPGSVWRNPENLEVRFEVTDYLATIPIYYQGILPDLFAENEGIVAVGRLDEQGRVMASQVLAKHDEKYMPPEVARALEAAGRLKPNLYQDRATDL
jgi:cytochrome c-type biogenesis protein CcmE